MHLIEQVQTTIRRHAMFARGQQVLVGVSGGADSVALLAILRELAPELGLRLTVAHLNHRIRGQAAAADALFVKALARSWGLKFAGGRTDVPRLARRRGISLEMAGREARYAFFARAARARRCAALATAHTADDQAETILLKLARGAGGQGLTGIPHVSLFGRLRVVRPLRDVARQEIIRFLKRRKTAWREDATNTDPAFARNRVRHRILPFLERNLNPRIRQALLRAGEIMEGENEWLDRLARDLFLKCAGGNSAGLSGARLAPRLPAARRRVLRLWLVAAGFPPEKMDFDAIARLDDLLTDPRGGRTVTLTNGWRARKQGGKLIIDQAGSLPPEPYQVRLKIPGTIRLRTPGVTVTATIGPGIFREKPRGIGVFPVRASLGLEGLDRRRIAARSWRPGDRMRPLGLNGSKKIQDIFADAKTPRELRHRIPLIACGAEIVWLPGYRIAQGRAVADENAPALQLAIRLVKPGVSGKRQG